MHATLYCSPWARGFRCGNPAPSAVPVVELRGLGRRVPGDLLRSSGSVTSSTIGTVTSPCLS